MSRPDVSGPLPAAQAARLWLHEFGAVTLWCCAAHSMFFLCATPLLHAHVPRLADQTPVTAFSAGLVGLLALWDATGLWLGSPINPVMTLSLRLAGRLSTRAALVLCAAQFAANACAAAVARAAGHVVASEFVDIAFSPPAPAPGVGYAMAVAFECVATATFCLVMLSLDDLVAKDEPVRRFAVTSGLFVALMQVGAGWTGSIMNPALVVAFAAFSGKWDLHSVYWLGPGLGAVVAALLFNARERRKRVAGSGADGGTQGDTAGPAPESDAKQSSKEEKTRQRDDARVKDKASKKGKAGKKGKASKKND